MRLTFPDDIGAVLAQKGTKYANQVLQPRTIQYQCAQKLFNKFRGNSKELKDGASHFMHRRRVNVIHDRRHNMIWFVIVGQHVLSVHLVDIITHLDSIFPKILLTEIFSKMFCVIMACHVQDVRSTGRL